MKPALVVDIGNSFIKWGRCADGAVVEKAYLPPNEPDWKLPTRMSPLSPNAHAFMLPKTPKTVLAETVAPV